MRRIYFITHPNVEVSPSVPVTQWPLSEKGRLRMREGLRQSWVSGITSVYSSSERKAKDGAEILARHLSLTVTEIPELGENDRSSTGYLPSDEFETFADLFFGNPDLSVQGWESANDAQRRIVSAVTRLVKADWTNGSIAVVSHGAVGTLLYCALAGVDIDRKFDQGANGGGNYFSFSLAPTKVFHRWKAIDGNS